MLHFAFVLGGEEWGKDTQAMAKVKQEMEAHQDIVFLEDAPDTHTAWKFMAACQWIWKQPEKYQYAIRMTDDFTLFMAACQWIWKQPEKYQYVIRMTDDFTLVHPFNLLRLLHLLPDKNVFWGKSTMKCGCDICTTFMVDGLYIISSDIVDWLVSNIGKTENSTMCDEREAYQTGWWVTVAIAALQGQLREDDPDDPNYVDLLRVPSLEAGFYQSASDKEW
eukprot:gene18067-24491_t